jgi:hypothetical protein
MTVATGLSALNSTEQASALTMPTRVARTGCAGWSMKMLSSCVAQSRPTRTSKSPAAQRTPRSSVVVGGSTAAGGTTR